MALLGPLNWKWYQYSTRRDTRPRMKPVQIVQYSTVQYDALQYSTSTSLVQERLAEKKTSKDGINSEHRQKAMLDR